MHRTMAAAALIIVMAFCGCAGEKEGPAQWSVAGSQWDGQEDAQAPVEDTQEEVVMPDGCTDSDGGYDIHEKGTARLIEGGEEKWEKEDFCFDDGLLYEYYCENGALTHKSVKCTCFGGVCEPMLDFAECVDSDGGNEKHIYGEIRLIKHYTDGRLAEEFPAKDTCLSGVELIEYFCEQDGSFRHYVYTCTSCNAGACSR